MKKIKVSVLGANGQLGQEFQYLAGKYETFNFSFFSREDVDITSESAIRKMISDVNPDYIINCAAYTAVDKAESDIKACYDVNTIACQKIANAINGSKVRLIHFSSDYVYHVYDGMPLREDGPTEPKSIYAKSKYEGEEILRKSGIEVMIIRTSWVISSFGNNFVKTMLRLGKERSSLNVVNDQYGAPSYARHLAKTILEIIIKLNEDPTLSDRFNQTYNFANEGVITWYDLASMIIKEAKLPCIINPVPSSAYPTQAVRPKWSILSKHKLKEAFNITIPHWHAAVKECMDAIVHNK
ncbi:MAG: dTDP-4-dehydrorhamnose reductase [Saprospiraceae bacterium]|nr:dTDP-4-dehydrorhamnose reductase [Saprospiraceae bacterium]